MSDRYSEAAAQARAWRVAAEAALTNGTWVPSSVERQIAADVGAGTRLPAVLGGPPYVKMPMWRRLGALAMWAPVLRLGLAAGGWHMPAAPPKLPTSGMLVDLPCFLAALYGPAQVLEEWSQRLHALDRGGTRDEEQAASDLAEEVPHLGEGLDDAEQFFIGLRSVGVTLSEVATRTTDV
jgi:hypothetical protein